MNLVADTVRWKKVWKKITFLVVFALPEWFLWICCIRTTFDFPMVGKIMANFCNLCFTPFILHFQILDMSRLNAIRPQFIFTFMNVLSIYHSFRWFIDVSTWIRRTSERHLKEITHDRKHHFIHRIKVPIHKHAEVKQESI